MGHRIPRDPYGSYIRRNVSRTYCPLTQMLFTFGRGWGNLPLWVKVFCLHLYMEIPLLQNEQAYKL